jgi:sugar phosphate isomerase/epimerase
MRRDQLAAQTYTIRDYCRNSHDFASSCKKLRTIGYRAIQVSAVGPIPEEELTAICHGEGIAICATHEPGTTILSNPAAVSERLEKLGCQFTAYPIAPAHEVTDIKRLRGLAAKLDAAGAVLRSAGQVLAYHNHAIEFIKHGDQTVLDILLAETDPENVQAELDTYWIQVGGGDPVAWCRKLAGRLPLLHLKDCVGTTENSSRFCEVGRGNLNFPAIIDAAESSGCQWFIVEQDVCSDPFESLRMSFDYLTGNFVQ